MNNSKDKQRGVEGSEVPGLRWLSFQVCGRLISDIAMANTTGAETERASHSRRVTLRVGDSGIWTQRQIVGWGLSRQECVVRRVARGCRVKSSVCRE